MITVRAESPGDARHIRAINEQAFGQPMEADLVDRLRSTCPEGLSLVADDAGTVVGHILFTPVVVASGSDRWRGWGWRRWR